MSETVAVAPKKAKGLVNAVLRRVADAEVSFPDDATRLSYPDWIVERVCREHGPTDGLAALAAMNERTAVDTRDDGWIQGRASLWVADAVPVEPDDKVADLCAGPGGKATAVAHRAGVVVAADRRRVRLAPMQGAADVVRVVADGRRPPLRSASFDAVLVDAPCSGLGVLSRRPDARWRVEPNDVDELAEIQTELLDAAAELVAPGGSIVYSVCTLTTAETTDVDQLVEKNHPELEPLGLPDDRWRHWGRGRARLAQRPRHGRYGAISLPVRSALMNRTARSQLPRRLNLGCGFDHRDGYLNVDIKPEHEPDLLADIRDLSELPAGHFDEIVAIDVPRAPHEGRC